MALSHSSSIATNGLVFYYDMGNPQKSWKGAPTTNLVNPSWASWSVDGSGQGSIGTRTITSIYECLITDNAANTRQNIYVFGVAANTTYTFSVQYKKVFGAPTLRFQLQSYNGGTFLGSVFPTTIQLGITDKEGFQTASYSYTTAAGADRVLWFMQDGDDYTTYTHSFILANAQCEQGSFATPFVAGTRTNTQALLDLTNKSTITASSLTYNSDGMFSFNGASNYVSLGASTTYLPMPQFTLETWHKSSGLGSGMSTGALWGITYGIVANIYSDGNVTFNTYNSDTSSNYSVVSTSGANLFNNAWRHVVYVVGPSTSYIYVDGVLNASASNSGSWSGTNIWSSMAALVGNNPNDIYYYFNGQIPVARIYNRALTDSEVRQNFNALRGRYGL